MVLYKNLRSWKLYTETHNPLEQILYRGLVGLRCP